MSPRLPLSQTHPELITADRLARWAGVTPTAVRIAARRGLIPAPDQIQVQGRTRTMQVQAWRQEHRDEIIRWAVGTGNNPYLPPHLHAGWTSTPEIADGFGCWSARGELEVVTGFRGAFALVKWLIQKSAGARRCEGSVGLGYLGQSYYRGELSQAAGYRPIYLLPAMSLGDCHLEDQSAVVRGWPFSLTFPVAEVCAMPGSSSPLPDRTFPAFDHTLHLPSLNLPALCTGETAYESAIFCGADTKRVQHIRTLRARLPHLEGDLRELAIQSLRTAIRRIPSGKEYFPDHVAPFTESVLEARIDEGYDLASDLPPQSEFMLTDEIRRCHDVDLLRAAAYMWEGSSTAFNLDLGDHGDDVIFESASPGGSVPFELLSQITDFGRLIEEDVFSDFKTFTARSAAGETMPVAHFKGRTLAIPPRRVMVPDSPLIRIELPDGGRRDRPAYAVFQDGSVWPMPLGSTNIGHLSGYVGGTPAGFVRSIKSMLFTSAGEVADPDRFSSTPEEIKRVNAISTTRWPRRRLLEIWDEKGDLIER